MKRYRVDPAVRPWHPQLGYLPPEDDDPLDLPAPTIDHSEGIREALTQPEPAPVEHESFIGWIIDDETGMLRPADAAPPRPQEHAPAPDVAKPPRSLGAVLRGIVAERLRRLAARVQSSPRGSS